MASEKFATLRFTHIIQMHNQKEFLGYIIRKKYIYWKRSVINQVGGWSELIYEK